MCARAEIDQLILKFIQKYKEQRVAKSIFKKQRQGTFLISSYSDNGIMNRHINQCNITDTSDINPCIQIGSNIALKIHCGSGGMFSLNAARTTAYQYPKQ